MTTILDMCANGVHQPKSGTHILSEHLSIPLGLPGQIKFSGSDLPDPEQEDYILVIANGEDAAVIKDVLHRLKVSALIAWHLDENYVKALLQWPVHVFIGKPNKLTFRDIIKSPLDRNEQITEINMCSRLALMETQIFKSIQQHPVQTAPENSNGRAP